MELYFEVHISCKRIFFKDPVKNSGLYLITMELFYFLLIFLLFFASRSRASEYVQKSKSFTNEADLERRQAHRNIDTYTCTYIFACVPRFSFESTRVCSVYAFRNKPKNT